MLNLNFDMVGSPNYVRFVYDGDNSAFPVGPGAALGPDGSGQIESVFVSYFRNQGLQSDPTPFSGRSDYGPFIAKGGRPRWFQTACGRAAQCTMSSAKLAATR